MRCNEHPLNPQPFRITAPRTLATELFVAHVTTEHLRRRMGSVGPGTNNPVPAHLFLPTTPLMPEERNDAAGAMIAAARRKSSADRALRLFDGPASDQKEAQQRWAAFLQHLAQKKNRASNRTFF